MRKLRAFIFCIFLLNVCSAQKQINIQVLNENNYTPLVNWPLIIDESLVLSNDDGRIFFQSYQNKIIIKYTSNELLKVVTLNSIQDTTITFLINVDFEKIDTIDIGQEKSFIKTDRDRYVFDQRQLQNSVLPIGTMDPIHLINFLPGVSNSQELNSGLNIRGASIYNTTIFLDDVPMPNISHSFGFFSLFDANLISGIEYFSSNVSTYYGNRGTSYIKFTGLKPSINEIRAFATWNPFAFVAHLSLPIIKNKIGFEVSLRKSTFDSLYSNNVWPVFTDFYDFYIKTRIIVNKLNTVDIMLMQTKDHNYPESMPLGNGSEFSSMNKYKFSSFSIRHEGVLKNKWQVKNVAFASYYENNYRVPGYEYFNNHSTSNEYNFKSQLSKVVHDRSYKIGFEGSHNLLFQELMKNTDSIPETRSMDYLSLFSDLEYHLGKFQLMLHLRPSWNFNLKQNVYLEYRLGSCYNLNDKMQFIFNYNKFNNFRHTLTSTLMGKPSDYAVLSDGIFLPEETHEWLIGLDTKKRQKHVKMTAFYRKQLNILDFKNLNSSNFYYSSNLATGNGLSYGIESMCNFPIRIHDLLMVSYTFSRSFYQNSFVDKGKIYPTNFDRPHKFVLSYQHLREKGKWIINFTFQNGRAITAPLFNVYLNGARGIPIYSNRNEMRLPLYHRLDIGYQLKSKKTKRLKQTLNFYLYNAYFHPNVYGVVFQFNDDIGIYEHQYLSLFPILPSINYKIEFN